MNPFSAVTWFWQGWRNRSLTSATLFALAMVGFSVLGGFRHLLVRLGAPWYVWLLLPMVVLTILARKEADWLPDPEVRRKWARRLIWGSILVSVLLALLAPRKKSDATGPVPAATDGGRANPHGR